MNVSVLIGLIEVGINLVKKLKVIVDDAGTVLKEEDQTILKGKLNELLAEVRSLSDSTGKRLRGDSAK